MLFFIVCAALAACTDEEGSIFSPDYGKTPIELSVGGVDAPSTAATRAVITDGTNKTLNPFDVDTKIFMVMESEYGTDDFGGSHTTKYNVARGDINKSNNDNTNNRSIVEFDTKNQRYWDDAHARSSQLSIWAYAQKGQSEKNAIFNSVTYDTDGTSQPFAWSETEVVPTIVTWRASQESDESQTEQSVLGQDLLFSNNLANYDTDPSTDSSKDKRLKFNFSTRKFPQVGEAHMIFYHAMSKITIKIVEGEGFDKTSANKANDFKFTTTGGNVILKQFNHTGTFDIKQGEFTSIAAGGTTDIPSIYLQNTNTDATGEDPHYTLEALAVPSIANNGASRFVDDQKSLSTDVMMEFTIDNNLYQITHDELYEALKDNANATKKTDNGTYIPLEAGKNYIFTFTVGKTKIKNITAQVAEWENVDADNITPTNARITLNVEDRSGLATTSEVTSDMDIYRTLDMADAVRDDYEGYNWKTGYTTDGKAQWKNTTLAYNSAESRWSTDWFWESNQHYYHIRTLSPTSQVVTEDTSKGDYTTITSASCTSEANYNQAAWGAPFADVHEMVKFTYHSTYGLDGIGANASTPYHQIYKAIGPTLDQIKVLMFHMYSGVHFTIKTTGGNDKVKLFDGTNRTRVDLVAYYPEGKVRLGTCAVDASGTLSTAAVPYNVSFASATDAGHYTNQEYYFSAVPQNLRDVKLHITTPDHNLYIVDLADVIVTGDPNDNATNIGIEYDQKEYNKYIINRWYPGFKYNYSFTLKKTGITNLQATIVQWENVTADDETVQIK